MNKNFKKVAIALLATNVIASTVLTALPAVETHAAENKLNGVLQASQGITINPITNGDTQVTGHVVGGAGKQVTIGKFVASRIDYMGTTMADANGDFVLKMDPIEARQRYITVTCENGASTTSFVRYADPTLTATVTDAKVGDTVLHLKYANLPNTEMNYVPYNSVGTAYTSNQFYAGKTDANGNLDIQLSVPLKDGDSVEVSPSDYKILSRTFYRVFAQNPTVDQLKLNTNVSSITADKSIPATGNLDASLSSPYADKEITYTSSNPNVITVDSSGKWNVVGVGSATITVNPTKNPAIAKTIPVTVTDATATNAATTSVNDLFINNSPANSIKTTTDQAAINAAQTKVNAVTDTVKKAELQSYVTKAQNELNARIADKTAQTIAFAAVNDLFINNNPIYPIKDTTNQAAIDAAQAKVNLVVDAYVHGELQKQIDQAKAELAARAVTDQVKASVNNLFADAPTNSVLKDTTTQAMIDAASAQVNALPASTDKTKLQGEIATANTLFGQITQTTIAGLTSDATTVSGKGEPNSTIVIKNGSTTIASGKVASDGNYLFFITPQAGGSTITATVTKASNGKTSSASTKIVDETIVTTTINNLTAIDNTVSGKGEPNSSIVIKNGNVTIASGQTASDGNYLFFITPQAGGSTITATVTKASNGKISSASTTIADETIAQTTISALTADSTSVSGVGEPNATIVIKNGDTTIASGKIASDGSYLFNISKQSGGSTITATATKASNGKTSSASTKIADETIATTTINDVTATSTNVSGTGEPNADIVIKNGNTTIASGKTASNGSYLFNITPQAAGSTITATITKASNGKVSTASTLIPAALDYSLKANSYKVGTANLTGTYGKNIAKVRLFVNDKLVIQATTSNGTFTFPNIASFITKPTDKVEVVGVDGSYVERARVAVTVTGDPVYDYSLTANDYTLGNATLTGKYGKDVSKVRLWVNNVVVSQATTNADGTYTFDKVPSFVKLATDKVEVVGVNAAYNEVARKTVVTKGSSILDTSLTANNYAKGAANLTGTFGKDISKVRLWVNGAVVQQATTSNGNYTFTNIAKFILNKDDVVQVVGVDAQYNEKNRITVTKTGFDTLDNSLTAPADFTLNKDTAINGTMGTNVANVRLSVNGVIVKQAAKTGNTYSIAGANNYITSTTDVVKIIAVDAQYKEVASKNVTVKADSTVYDYALAVNPYIFGATTITGSYGKDVSAVRLWVNGAVVKTASNSNGTFTINGLASITSTTDKVEIVAVNAAFKEVARTTIQQ